MTRTILASSISLYLGIIAVFIVYNFQTPRQWALTTLSQKENASSHVASALTGFDSTRQTKAPLAPEVPGEATTTTPATYQYKVIENVDPCTLNKLGAQGWHAVQFGGTLVQTAGRDENCLRSGLFSSLDWALFEKNTQ